jgi:ferredoxin
MPIITFIRPDNRSENIEANIGESAMQVATRHGVDEIVAECGGNAMCMLKRTGSAASLTPARKRMHCLMV